MAETDELLKGAVDIHVHSGPGMISRKLDHYEATRQCLQAGIRALVLKDHHAMTMGAAYFINNYLAKGQPVKAYGSGRCGVPHAVCPRASSRRATSMMCGCRTSRRARRW